MLALLALFLAGILVGSRYGKRGFGSVSLLLLVFFVLLCIMWQDIHYYPGVVASAFVSQVGKWAIATLMGLLIGRLIVSNIPIGKDI